MMDRLSLRHPNQKHDMPHNPKPSDSGHRRHRHQPSSSSAFHLLLGLLWVLIVLTVLIGWLRGWAGAWGIIVIVLLLFLVHL